jgi:two-component system cell cycle sensor histidine kinase PleC
VTQAEQGRTGQGQGRIFGLPGRLGLVIAALVALEGGALALKAYDEKRTSERHTLASLQREAAALAEHVNGRAERAVSVVGLGQKAGAGRGLVDDSLPDTEMVLSLRDAAQSPQGSRIRAAADTAMSSLASRESLGLTRDGDLVLVTSHDALPKQLAFTDAASWLPAPRDGRRYMLAQGDIRAGSGDRQLAEPARTASLDRPRIQSVDGLPRTATACAPLASGALQACVTRPAPMFKRSDLLHFLSYGLLLAAPALAILGLARMVARGETRNDGQAARMRSAEAQLDLVMTGARAGSFRWNTQTDTVRLSPMAGELLGLDADAELTGQALLASVHPREHERVANAVATAPEKGWLHVDFATETSQGRQFVELRASPNGEAGPDDFSGIIMDVTEQKIADLRLRAAERRLRNAIEGFSGPFALWDKRRRLLYWNRAFARDFRLEETLRPGIGHETVGIARADAIRREVPSLEESDTCFLELHNGCWLKLVERTTNEDVTITLGLDVTNDVRNEEQLKRQKAKLKQLVFDLEQSEGHAAELAKKYDEERARAEHAAHTKSAFLANMSHELRTPLNAINGFSEILSNELYGPLGDARYKGYADDILTSGQHLLDLINDILDMAKIEAGKMTIACAEIDPVDPVDAAVRMVRHKAEEKEIRLVLKAPQDLPRIDADHRAIRQMVLNLVSNALKFTDKGGHVVVSLDQVGREMRIAVTDDGIGIPKEHIPRLAQPFEQVADTRDRNTDGTGLGLALTKSFAEMHGGRISIASQPEKGTRVSIYLPLAAAGSGCNDQTQPAARKNVA